MKWYLRRCFKAGRPLLCQTKTPLFPRSPKCVIDRPYPITPYSSARSKERKMSQYPIHDNNNSFNTTNSFNNNVWNNFTIADDRFPLLAWLSPLEPKLRHRGIQDHRVDNVGEWLLQTEEFRTWHDGSGEGDKAVLFCYGGPGVGKTFIR